MFFHQGCAHFVEGNWFARFVLRRFVKQTLNELALIVDCSTRIRNHDFSEIICCDSKSALRATLAGLEMAVRTVFFRCTNESKKKKKKCEVGKETNRSQRYQFKCKIRSSYAETMHCFVPRRGRRHSQQTSGRSHSVSSRSRICLPSQNMHLHEQRKTVESISF